MKLKLKPQFIEQYKQKYPLITKDIFQKFPLQIEEGDIIDIYTNNNKFIAKGYYGVQNKGFGWVLSYNQNQQIDTEFFINKIKSAIKYRESYFKDAKDDITTAFRVFNGEGDGVGGLTIDYFNKNYMITWYSLGIYRFKDMIVDALKQTVEYISIYEKRRFDPNGQYMQNSSDHIAGDIPQFPIIVKENCVKFAVYLDDGAMTGIFLDQKDVRKQLKEKYSKGKTVLNTFSYTGAFSVVSAIGGALKTTSVDLAKRSLIKTKEQFSINGCDLNNQEIIVDDVFNYFKYAVKKKYLFDIVVVDPPSFARSKKITFSVTKDYVKLLKDVIQITNKNGIIVASTNYANFGMARFRSFVELAFKELKTKYKIQESYSLPKDFKTNDKFIQSDYLKVLFIKKLG